MPEPNHANSSQSLQSESAATDVDRRLRILAIGEVIPWPPKDGYTLRFSASLSALSQAGDLDVFIAVHDKTEGTITAAPEGIGRFEIALAKSIPPSAMLARRAISSRLPLQILSHDWNDARDGLERFAQGPYDVVWYMHGATFMALGDPSLGPAVVDLDNLVNNLLHRPMSSFIMMSTPTEGRLRFPRVKVEDFARWVVHLRDRPAWSWLQRVIARRASAVALCSEVDRKRLNSPRAAVIPNSYRDPGPPTGSVPRAPVLVMVGLYTYRPNLDGAVWLANYVMPELRRVVPDAVVRFVGRHDERLERIASVPGVEIVGEVADVGPELRSARGAVVPILHGSGTRIKIVEALAYALPVVTTSMGCEGLELTTEIHALIGDDPAKFAADCARILTDDALCERLQTDGRNFFLERYDSNVNVTLVGQLARNVASTRARFPNGPPNRLQSSLYGRGRRRPG